MADHTTFWPARRPLPQCAGDCNQGRAACKSPVVCGRTADIWEPVPFWASASFIAGMAVASAALIAGIAWLTT